MREDYIMVVNDELFFIDSNNYDSVKHSKIYGYIIEDTDVIDEKDNNYNEEKIYNSMDGCYCQLYRTENIIKMVCDNNGYMRLFYYQNQDYFAVSNSFLFLVEQLRKNNIGLTVNYDIVFCNLTASFYFPQARNTIVNEINTLRPEEYIKIDTEKKKFNIIQKGNINGNTIDIDSEEGIELLDKWHAKWKKIIRQLYKDNKTIDVDLSGGIDSRLVLTLLLNANVSLDSINIISYKDGLHTHSEDYNIAEILAEKFGFKLNKGTYHIENMSHEEMLKIGLYNRFGVHKQIYFKAGINKEKRYRFTGASGEKIRGYWHSTPEHYINWEKHIANINYSQDYERMSQGIECEYGKIFEYLEKKYNINDTNSSQLVSLLWNDIADAGHFGTLAYEAYMGNEILLSPLSDSSLTKLKLVNENVDYDLLAALIFVRYMPDLLDIKFDSGHSLRKESIEKAKSINEKYHKSNKETCKLMSREHKYSECKIEKGKSNKAYNDRDNKFLKECFFAPSFASDICSLGFESIYISVCVDVEKREYFPLLNAYPLFLVGYINNKEDIFFADYLNRKHIESADYALSKISNYFIDLKARDDEIMNVYSKWVTRPDAIKCWLKKYGYGEIAVYGIGRLGHSLIDSLKSLDIDVKFIIDKQKWKSIDGIKLYSPNDAFEECDVIICTALTEYENIKYDLQEKTTAKIVSLKDIWNDI